MGVTVCGAVEASLEPDEPYGWQYVLDIWPYVNRTSPGLECLWGQKASRARFEPVVERSGLPENVSERVRDSFDAEYCFGERYATLAELRAVDWAETGSGQTYDYCEYIEGTETGHELSPSRLADLPLSDEQRDRLADGGDIYYERDGKQRRLERSRLTRERACRLGGWWWVIQEAMERLTDTAWEPDGVRLVVWFYH